MTNSDLDEAIGLLKRVGDYTDSTLHEEIDEFIERHRPPVTMRTLRCPECLGVGCEACEPGR